MTRPHKLYFAAFLTLLRVPLVLLFLAGAVVRSLNGAAFPWLAPACLLCLAAAAVTDMFDGYFARLLKVTTKFGACADPLADKVFYVATLPLLVFIAAKNGNIPHATVLLCFAVVLLIRDQWVSFLRSIGAGYDIDLSANWSGKARTAVNFPLIWLIYYAEASGGGAVNQTFLYALEAAGFAINLVSVWVYTRRYWPCLRDSLR